GSDKVKAKTQPQPAVAPVQPAKRDLEQEITRLRSELEYRSRITNSLQHFLERISCADPARTYNSIVSNSKELFECERASLFVFDETAKELVPKAASGGTIDTAKIRPVRAGEGVSGKVIDSGQALIVADLRREGRTPASSERSYKTNSFICYP